MKQLFSSFIIGIMICAFAINFRSDKSQHVNVKEGGQEVIMHGNSDSLLYIPLKWFNQPAIVRDSRIVFCSSTYQYMFDLQKENQNRQGTLCDELNTAYKQNRKNYFEKRTLSRAVMIRAGITASVFIKSLE